MTSKKTIMTVAVIIYIMLFTASCSNSSDSSPLTVVLGDEYSISYGMTQAQVEEQIGESTEIKMNMHSYDGIAVCYREDAVVGIRFPSSSEWTTIDGIGLGSSIDDLTDTYDFSSLLEGELPLGIYYEKSNNSLKQITKQEYDEADMDTDHLYIGFSLNTNDNEVFHISLGDKFFDLTMS